MGNKICSFRRNMVEERYTRPQRLVRQSSSVDYKKLRKLILSEKLAPCFDGVDDSELNSDLEECPICFFFYPSLNRSRCCMKGICTECFLQMKPSPATQLTQCPFCKSSSYTVEYRGAKTKEEKGIEQAEEQKVIDAKLRMRFEELENADEVRPVNRNQSALEIQSPNSEAMEVSNIDAADSSVVSAWSERQAEFGLDLEEIMMMEAIWRSIQDTSSQKGIKLQSSGSNRTGGSRMIGYPANESMTSSASISLSSGSIPGGIASAVARIAERNIRQSGALSSVDDLAQTSQTQDENSILEHEIEHVGSSADHDFDDARSNNEGLTSTSTTDDDSWDSFSPCIVETNQEDSENEYNSDQDLVMEPNDTDTCSSSVHTISDEDSESLNSSDTYQNPTYSPHLEYFASKTNFREFANSNS